MRIALIVAVAAFAAACTPMTTAEPEMEAEFMMTGPIPVVPGGF